MAFKRHDSSCAKAQQPVLPAMMQQKSPNGNCSATHFFNYIGKEGGELDYEHLLLLLRSQGDKLK